jgi:hypothetical protein
VCYFQIGQKREREGRGERKNERKKRVNAVQNKVGAININERWSIGLIIPHTHIDKQTRAVRTEGEEKLGLASVIVFTIDRSDGDR